MYARFDDAIWSLAIEDYSTLGMYAVQSHSPLWWYFLRLIHSVPNFIHGFLCWLLWNWIRIILYGPSGHRMEQFPK